MRHLSTEYLWTGDNGGDSTRGGSSDDVDDGKREGLSERSDIEHDGRDEGFGSGEGG